MLDLLNLEARLDSVVYMHFVYMFHVTIIADEDVSYQTFHCRQEGRTLEPFEDMMSQVPTNQLFIKFFHVNYY